MTPRQRCFATYQRIEHWLFEAALPLWSTTGVDQNGGFYEKITQDGLAVEESRRTRVVARQIYCFAAADRMGWAGDGASLVTHGFEALRRHLHPQTGLVIAKVGANGTPVDLQYDFYDHAFALFALANVATLSAHRAAALSIAHHLQDVMEASYRHTAGGFTEPGDFLRANPHMHMLEACLALSGVDADASRWRAIADGIVDLACERFIDPVSGAVREFFHHDWAPITDAEGQVVEPGHQFEWAWLLSAWNETVQDGKISKIIEGLGQIALDNGIDQRGITIDELNSDLSLRSTTARAWPQCERLKYHVEVALAAEDDNAPAWDQANEALAAWEPFLATPIAGLWFDRLTMQGTPVQQPAPASTLYHLVCALETAGNAFKGHSAVTTLQVSHLASAA